MNLDFSYMVRIIPDLLSYIPITLFIAVVSMFFAIILGLILAFVRLRGKGIAYHLAGLFISFFRGMPALVQLFLIYYGLPQLIPAMSSMSALTAAILGFSIRESAYLSEIFRASIRDVPFGQREAGLMVGMTPWQINRDIILPQALFNALPASGNIFIMLLKQTSVAFTLGITELFAEAKIIASETFRYFETFLMVGIMYWALCSLYSALQSGLERRLGVPYTR